MFGGETHPWNPASRFEEWSGRVPDVVSDIGILDQGIEASASRGDAPEPRPNDPKSCAHARRRSLRTRERAEHLCSPSSRSQVDAADLTDDDPTRFDGSPRMDTFRIVEEQHDGKAIFLCV